MTNKQQQQQNTITMNPILASILKNLRLAFQSSVIIGFGYLGHILHEKYGLLGLALSLIIPGNATILYFTFAHKISPSTEKRINDTITYEAEGLTLHYLMEATSLGINEMLLRYFVFYKWSIIYSEAAGTDQEDPAWLQYLYYIPMSFVWELVIDFFHYWVHRICHTNKFLYKWVHSGHHEHDKPGPLSTFKMSYFENIFAVIFPNIMAFLFCYICGMTWTPLQLHWLFVFRTTVEISGHSGIDSEYWVSFLQFPFFVNWSGICLHIKDHDLHHGRQRVNFSKRFRLWDFVFNTFDSLEQIERKRFLRRLDIRLNVMGINRRISALLFGTTPPPAPKPDARRETVFNPIGADDNKEASKKKKEEEDNNKNDRARSSMPASDVGLRRRHVLA